MKQWWGRLYDSLWLYTELLQIVNLSLTFSVFQKPLKTALIKPLLKWDTIDTTQMNKYRHIFNLPCLSKIIENVFFQQPNNFLKQNNCCHVFQSGFRQQHGTEKALTKFMNDVCEYSWWENVSVGFTGFQCCFWYGWPHYITPMIGTLVGLSVPACTTLVV